MLLSFTFLIQDAPSAFKILWSTSVSYTQLDVYKRQGYIYDEEIGDPDNGIEPGTKWEDVPDDFVCPLCGVGKDQFSEAE